MIFEAGAQFYAFNSLIKEARMNNAVPNPVMEGVDQTLFPSTQDLIEKLVIQGPHRVYTSPEGRVLRVLMFSEDRRKYQCFAEVLGQTEDRWKRIKAEYSSWTSPEFVEGNINFLRAQWNMKYDLLRKPMAVFKIIGTNSSDYLHLSEASEPAYFSYYVSNLGGIRTTGIGFAGPCNDLSRLDVVAEVPPEVIRYSEPFAKAA